MISAERFSQTAGSYWGGILPGLTKFVYAANRNVSNFGPRIFLRSDPHRHAVVSEAAFLRWSAFLATGVAPSAHEVFSEASRRLAVEWGGDPYADNFTDREASEVECLFGSLCAYLDNSGIDDIKVEPRLPGCGIVSGGKPDFIGVIGSSGGCLSTVGEIKTVERTFRATDFRQMVSYAVLKFVEAREVVDLLTLVNPMRGVMITFDIDSFFWFTRSQAADEALAEIAFDWSGPTSSQ